MKWIAPPKTRAELAQIERAMQGRYSIGEPLPRQGVSVGAGAAIPMTPRARVLPVDDPPPTRRGTPKPVPGVCECVPPCIKPIPIFSKETQTQMLSPTEKAICQMTGVAEADFAHAKTKRSPFPDHKPDDFDDSRGGGREFIEAADSDDDGSYPADSDQSAGAHIARAKNHLEALGDPDDEVAPDERIDKAIDSLMRAREQRRGSAGALGQHARVRFVR